ncbi:MAG TPA: exopolyphosphatase [Luteibaculaceae bacterium]|nr:exopolyphosphatase [Luteibaculaceae bacterium]
MRIGAIDIGSNAMRLLIADAYEEHGQARLKKLSLIRVPVRLGETVFTQGSIPAYKIKKLAKSIHAFVLLMEVYGVVDYRICATSAMREAQNQQEVLEQVKKLTGCQIEVIDGDEEAQLIHSTFETLAFDFSKVYLYIDVGGGSTELSVIKEGKPIVSQSFKVGTVRSLKKTVHADDVAAMLRFAQEMTADFGQMQAIGTGGNINKLVKLGPINNATAMNFSELSRLVGDLSKVGLMERMRVYDLKRDRADVIVPAGKIYIDVMKSAGIEEILIPKLGLSDGIIYNLYQQKR